MLAARLSFGLDLSEWFVFVSLHWLRCQLKGTCSSHQRGWAWFVLRLDGADRAQQRPRSRRGSELDPVKSGSHFGVCKPPLERSS